MAPISASQLRALRSDHTGMQWLQGMAKSGLRRSTCSEAAEAYTIAAQVDELDDAIQATFASEQFFFPLPKWWWVWVPLLYWLGFLWALQQDSFEERLFTWGWSMKLFGVVAGWILFMTAHREYRAKQEKLKRRPILRAERSTAMADLEAMRDRCIVVCAQGNIEMVE